MRDEISYWVYILTNKFNRVLYVGVTGGLDNRVLQHKQKLVEGFTKRYNVTKLVYFEEYQYVEEAILREKQIKGWLRKKKIQLIKSTNPTWRDLSEDFLVD